MQDADVALHCAASTGCAALQASGCDAPPHTSIDIQPTDATVDLGEDGLGSNGVHVAHVRYVPGETHLRLQLRIYNDRKTFNRPVDEPLGKLRHRLQVVATQAAPRAATMGVCAPYNGNRTRKERNKKEPHIPGGGGDAPLDVAVHFYTNDHQEITDTDGSCTVGSALLKTVRLVIDGDSYVVLHNQPVVVSLTVMEPVLVGIPIFPLVETEFCAPEHCAWWWFQVGLDTRTTTGSETTPCGTQRRFVPLEEHLGCRFRVECHAPSMDTCFARESAVVEVTPRVEAAPDWSVFGPRQALAATRASDGDNGNTNGAFRVMTYNVLYDGYTPTPQAKLEMFPYAKKQVTQEMYRVQLAAYEMEQANADIICLQEMGNRIFHSYFEPMFSSLDFHTFYTNKTGTTQEGCAVLVRRDIFAVVEERMLDLSAAVLSSSDPEVVALLAEFPEMEKGLRVIPSIAQVVHLRDKREPLRCIILVNTHLYYREDADMIRLLQAVAIVREIEQERERLLVATPCAQASVVFCGDLNAFPDTATTNFLLHGVMDSSHRHWQEAPSFVWDRPCDTTVACKQNSGPSEETLAAVMPACVRHDLQFQSACGIPEFTNFAGSFVGTLDYILIGGGSSQTGQLEVSQAFPLFTREQVSAEVALPSTIFPSDHISLIADVRWKTL